MNPALINNPIMIGGCGSSGTSLLSHLLNAHPFIYCGAELYLLNKRELYNTSFNLLKLDFQMLLKKGVPTTGLLNTNLLGSSTYAKPRCGLTFLYNLEKYGISSELVVDTVYQSNTFREFVDNLFQKILIKTTKTRWAEKTPSNCYCIGEFLELYPSGKYIHMVRDGRDVVVSLVKRGAPPEIAVRRWMHDTAMGLPFRGHPRYCEVKYEDLVHHPEVTLSKLMNFLGEQENVEAMLSEQSRGKLMNSHNTWTAQPTGPISKQATGKWKKHNYANKRYFEQLFEYTSFSPNASHKLGLKKECSANDMLHEFGYDPCDEWDLAPGGSLQILLHFLQEKIYATFFPKELYCQISYNPTYSNN